MKLPLTGATKSKYSELNRNEMPMREGDDADRSNKTYLSLDGSIEEAEDSILSNLEAQSRRTQAGSDGFRPAIPGERAPLGVDSVGSAIDSDDELPPTLRRPTFKQMARRVQLMQKLRSNSGDRSVRSRTSSNDEVAVGHRRARTLLASIDEAEKNEDANKESHQVFSNFRNDIFAGDFVPHERHEGLNFLWNKDERHPEEDEIALAESEGRVPGEERPLLGDNNVSLDTAVVMERRRLALQRKNELRWKRLKYCLQPVVMSQRLFQILINSTFVVSIPFFFTSGFLFYFVGNPELDFLPGQATVSWWLNFFGMEQLMTASFVSSAAAQSFSQVSRRLQVVSF